MNLTPEQEFEARASTLSREELCLMAKELWCEMTALKQLLRDRNAERDEAEHCKDCCCAGSWKALGITEYTGKSIPEHIAKLKDTLQVVAQMRQAQKALLAKHNEDNLREVNRLQSAVDYRLAELGVKAV